MANELEPAQRSCFPSNSYDIMAIGILWTFGSTPTNLMKTKWEKNYASFEIKAYLSANTVSSTLKIKGLNYDAQRKLFTKILTGTKYIIFDLLAMFTRSEKIKLIKKGIIRASKHKADHHDDVLLP